MEKLSSILLIDDDPITNQLHRKLIEGFGVAHQVEVVNDGEEGIQLLEQHIHNQKGKIPQLIFVDLDMPFMDGFQFLEAYQDLDFKNKSSVVVAVLTSSISRKDVNRAREFSVGAYIIKPLTKEKMMEIMEEHFGWHKDEKIKS